jgi:hypothetical protein
LELHNSCDWSTENGIVQKEGIQPSSAGTAPTALSREYAVDRRGSVRDFHIQKSGFLFVSKRHKA